MNSCVFHMFDYGEGNNLAARCNSVHFNLLTVFEELRHHDWMLWRNIGRLVQEKLTLPGVSCHPHGCATQNVGRPEKDGIAFILCKSHRIAERGCLPPCRLIHSDGI